jgi:uncharacterized membrane protein YphA (DoxX/SURF4 family)
MNKSNTSSLTLFFYIYLLGSLFVLSAVGKILDMYGFERLLVQYNFRLPWWVAFLFVLGELSLGLGLLFNTAVRLLSKIAFVGLICLTIIYLYGWLVLDITDCGCFGTLNPLTLPPYITVCRNAALLYCSFYILRQSSASLHFTPLKGIVLFLGLGTGLFVSGMTFKKSFSEFEINHPYRNKSLTATPLAQLLAANQDSTYFVFLFSYSCDACKESISALNEYKQAGIAHHIQGIALDHKQGVKQAFIEKYAPSFPITTLKSKDFWAMTDKVPTVFYIKQGKVQQVVVGKLPSASIFKKSYLLMP